MGVKDVWVCYIESHFAGDAQQRWNSEDCMELSNAVCELMKHSFIFADCSVCNKYINN